MTTETRPTDSERLETRPTRPAREGASKTETDLYQEDLDESKITPLKPIFGFSDGVLCGVLGMEALIILIVVARHILIRVTQ